MTADSVPAPMVPAAEWARFREVVMDEGGCFYEDAYRAARKLVRAVDAADTPRTDEGVREQIAREIEAHANYSEQFKPAPQFMVGLASAAEVVRMGGCCPAPPTIPVGNGDDSDVEAGRCCPHCRNSLSDHNRAVWNAGRSYGEDEPAPPPVSAEEAWRAWSGPKGFKDYDHRCAAFLAGWAAKEEDHA